MRALTYDTYGGADVLHVAAMPEPHAEPGQVRIQVAAASINPIDWKLVTGAMSGGKPLDGPTIPGVDAAGVVDEVGEGVTGVSVGDDVFGLGSSTQAEHAVLRAWAAKPASVDWSVAAAAPVAGETAERGLRLLGIPRGGTVFVDGGAGGVGAVVVQMALADGLTVVASAGPGNQDYLREIGAIPVVYGDGVADRVRTAAPNGVDGVFDVAGQTPADVLFAIAPRKDQVLSIANFGLGELGGRVTGGGSGDSRPAEALVKTAELLRESKVVIKVQTFPLDRAPEAYATSLSGHVRGKLVLLP
jgi:NADPH:quinone reductase-like Zn-dependent oxidoreductase